VVITINIITFEKLDLNLHMELMKKWLNDKDVQHFYHGNDSEFNENQIKTKYKCRENGEDSVFGMIINYEENHIGYIQYYEITDDIKMFFGLNENEGFYHAFDVFIGEKEYWNRGIGSEIVRSMLFFIFNSIKSESVFIDPQCWNKRAINCYKKCGFSPVKVLKENELHEGEYIDNLLMRIDKKYFLQIT